MRLFWYLEFKHLLHSQNKSSNYSRDTCFDAHLFWRFFFYITYCYAHAKIKWPHTKFALFNFSYELLIIFGLSCRIQSTPCEHCTTVKKIVFFNSQWKASKLVSVKINNGGTSTLVDRYFKHKSCSLTSQKVCFDWKQDSLFNMIYVLLEKVTRYARMSVDCLRASKLVTLGYYYLSKYYCFEIVLGQSKLKCQFSWLP